ncbi:hypothetical protein [Streptomyces sp. NPDC001415]
MRHVADEAVGGRPVMIGLSVRRLYCENPDCSKQTFAEQIAGLTVRYQRRTPALQTVVERWPVPWRARPTPGCFCTCSCTRCSQSGPPSVSSSAAARTTTNSTPDTWTCSARTPAPRSTPSSAGHGARRHRDRCIGWPPQPITATRSSACTPAPGSA